jgi:tRNA (guanine37-N1)-methyltransferase
MRIDAVTLFPDYFEPLRLSLIGKAMEQDLLRFETTFLRDFAWDKHHRVDDTPVGGGAGMVMKPEPWALALDHVRRRHGAAEPASGESRPTRPVLILPTPAGEVFTQSHAADLAAADHLIFACGRYEGIDHRVFDWAEDDFDVRPLSIGDYVLNGGEVAAIAMIEAITRLIPGVVGNPDSLVEESHASGLLEYPVYTKPATWRGREVPATLLSGDHARIAQWRQDQSLQRTRRVRPDLYARYTRSRHGGPDAAEESGSTGHA